jgi:hypothetical protein
MRGSWRLSVRENAGVVVSVCGDSGGVAFGAALVGLSSRVGGWVAAVTAVGTIPEVEVLLAAGAAVALPPACWGAGAPPQAASTATITVSRVKAGSTSVQRIIWFLSLEEKRLPNVVIVAILQVLVKEVEISRLEWKRFLSALIYCVVRRA